MRQSSRLKDSEAFSKLKDQQFLSEFAAEDDEEYVEESEFIEEVFDSKKKETTGLKKSTKKGRARKSAPKPDKIINETTEEVIDVDSNLILSEGSPRKKGLTTDADVTKNRVSKGIVKKPTPSKKSAAKKKINRNSSYTPPLEIINENLLSSVEEWDSFFTEENPKIKRKNRRYKTVIFPTTSSYNFNIDMVIMSPFRIINQKSIIKKPLEIKVNNNEISLIDEPLIIEGKLGALNVGIQVTSINFCKCLHCKRSTDKILLYAVSSERISIISVEIAKKEGIKLMKEVGHILPPESENFKTVSVVESILSISTCNSIYFLNSETFHQEDIEIIIEKGPQIITESSNTISCHSWSGKNIVVGTLSGRIHVFNTSMIEIYQIFVKLDSRICSLDWRDDFTILIGGNFPKIFSIDLRDPFIIETKVSTLASLPKVIWSQSLNSILFSDAENHGRRLEKSKELHSSIHHPIGTFDSMVNDMKTSLNHNITATSVASGSIHLAWMSDEAGHAVEYEKRIFSLKLIEQGVFELNLVPEYVHFQLYDTIKLYPSLQSCISVDWCPNNNFPGLLGAGYHNGLIVLITTDRFFI